MEEQRPRATAVRAATIRTRRCGPFMARGGGERARRYVPLAKSAWSAWYIHRACLGTLLAALSFAAGHAGVVKSEPYIWTNVKWGGGGYVTGIVAHPSAPNLLYIRTDVGGCYRWDAANQRWIPLLDWLPLSHANLFGGESIAIDPSNPNNVY